MKLAHVADCHLGFRQYDRISGGMNAREADVQSAFREAINGIILLQPHAVVFAGDIFHAVRAPNSAILFLFAELQRLRTGLGMNTPIVVISGDHDTPRSIESTPILPLYKALGVEILLGEPQHLDGATRASAVVERDGFRIVGVSKPWAHMLIDVPPSDKLNILVTHGETRAALAGPGGLVVNPHQGWDYIALGHYHVVTMVRPNMWYAGSLEFTSTDPWSELAKNLYKGWLEVDLERGQEVQVTRHVVKTRTHLNLGPLDGAGLSPMELQAEIERRCQIDLSGAIVRLVVDNVSRETHRALEHRRIATLKSRAFHFDLRFVKPEPERSTAETRARMLKSLDEQVEAFLIGVPLSPDVDRTEFVREGMRYFQEGDEE